MFPRLGPSTETGERRGLTFRTAAATVLMLGLAVGLTPADAEAFRTWCRSDPVVSIDHDLADIFVAAPIDELAVFQVTGPTQIVVTVPRGIDAELVLKDPVAFGRGEEITFASSKRLRMTRNAIEVTIKVFVPAIDDSMPVRVEFVPRLRDIVSPDSAEGVANEWIVLQTRI